MVGNAKKNENQNRSLQNESLVLALRNFDLNKNLLNYFSLFDVYQLYENIYQRKLSMISLIIQNSKIEKIDG